MMMMTMGVQHEQQQQQQQQGHERRGADDAFALARITEDNVKELRRINTAVFPVRYTDKFYLDVVHTPEDFTRFGKWVGAGRCRQRTYRENNNP